jgi:hypothetical protein
VSKHISEGTLGCFSIKGQLLLRSKIALAFLTVFPTPQAAAQLNQTELAAFYRRYAIDRMSVEAGHLASAASSQ